MASKVYIGQLISIKFTDRKNPIRGLIVDYNDNWTLMKYNPVDYVIDGYVIFRNKNIDGFKRHSEEKFVEKVVKLKGLGVTKEDNFPIDDLKTILMHLSDKFGVFQFHTKSEKATYLGRLFSIDSKSLVIDFLGTTGKYEGKRTFRPNDLRIIEFNTDYINSLKLIESSKNKKQSIKH